MISELGLEAREQFIHAVALCRLGHTAEQVMSELLARPEIKSLQSTSEGVEVQFTRPLTAEKVAALRDDLRHSNLDCG